MRRVRGSSARDPGACSRLDSELVDELSASRAIRGERISLATASIESEHLERARLFAKRILRDKSIELADEIRVTTAREVSLDPAFQHHESQLVQARGLGCQDALVCDVGERWPSPQCEALMKQHRTVLRAAALEEFRAVGRKPLEAMKIRRVVLHPKHVAWLARLDRTPPERLSKLRNVPLEDVLGSLGRVVGPDLVDELRGRDDLAGVKQEDCEHDGAAARRRASAAARPRVPRAGRRTRYSVRTRATVTARSALDDELEHGIPRNGHPGCAEHTQELRARSQAATDTKQHRIRGAETTCEFVS